MVLTAAQCIDHIRHTLGGDSDLNTDPKWILNQAGEIMVASHRWKWLERRPSLISIRQNVGLTSATWTEATKTLTLVGAFANYSHLVGDRLVITSGTGADQGEYIVASKTDSDAIVLETSIGAAADGSTDIAGRIEADTAELPSDFQELIAINATESLVNSINMVSYDQLLWLRTNQVQITNFNFYGAISHASAADGRGPQTPRLELWPSPQTADPSAFTMFYRAGWNSVTQDEQEISVPEWLEMLYVQFVRATARGLEEEETDEKGMQGYIQQVVASPLFAAMVQRDGMVQDTYGPLRGGAVESGVTWFDWGLHNTISGPQ